MKNKTKNLSSSDNSVHTMYRSFRCFQQKLPVTMRPTLSRQEWNINLGKLHWFTSNLLLLITWSTLFLIALFITLEQTHCTLVACDSKQMTTAFSSMLWIFTKIVYLQCCTYSGILFGSPLLVPCKTAAVSVHDTTMHHVMSLRAMPHT